MKTQQDRLEETVGEKAGNIAQYLHDAGNPETTEPEDILYTYAIREWGQQDSLVLTGMTLVVTVGGPHVEVELPSGRVFGYWGDSEPVIRQGSERDAIDLWDHYSYGAPAPLDLNRGP